jgi:SAM-dependent methyltransferase
VTLNDPELVRREYASETGLLSRRSIYENAVYESSDGPLEVTFSTVAALGPRSLLEVGCGPGEMAERIDRELAAEVVAVDISPRMVELARTRGLAAQVGDIQDLAFDDGSFDVVLAAWVLFHVPDLNRGLREIARVLRPGGHLVAVTNSELHLSEARELAGIDMRRRISFSRENGEEQLRSHFAAVERSDVNGWLTFADRLAVQGYVDTLDALLRRSQRPVSDFDGELRARTRVTVFVAEKAG